MHHAQARRVRRDEHARDTGGQPAYGIGEYGGLQNVLDLRRREHGAEITDADEHAERQQVEHENHQHERQPPERAQRPVETPVTHMFLNRSGSLGRYG